MARINRLRLPALASLVAVFSVAGTIAQAQEELDRKPKDCVTEGQIVRHRAVDNRNILFFMKGNKVFRNELPTACPVLDPGETRIVYRYRSQPSGSTKLIRLCDTDSITVEKKGTTGCRLGQFVAITPAEADVLEGKPAAAAPPATTQ
jgi:hypothetical protein